MPAKRIPCGGCGRFKKGDLYTTDQCRFCWLRFHDENYRRLWDDGLVVEVTPQHPVRPDGSPIEPKKVVKVLHGPGTILKNLLVQLGFDQKTGCACNRRMRQMDEWGVDGCEEHRQEILGWLKEEFQKQGWGSKLSAMTKAVTSGLAFNLNPLDPIGSLLDEVLRRSREAQSNA